MTQLFASGHVGKVYLVGAGPGDPGLITLRGIECLKRADVVLYDYLVNVRTLTHATSAELVCSGGHGRHDKWTQEQINQRMVDDAKAGKCVVRLKSGDPIVFGRAAEEFDALVENQIPFEVIPGVTAALAAGSYAGIPITHRDFSSCVALITGQEKPGKSQVLDYQALARFPGTLVVYMGVTTAKHWAKSLIENGKSADTPVALIRRCSWPDQRILHCRLDEVVDQVTPYQKFPPPVIAVVGAVTRLTDSLGWFQTRPLFGRSVLVTRPEHQADSLTSPLSELGAEVLFQSAIRIQPPNDWTSVDDAIRRMPEFDWIVFSSANGVRSFCDRILSHGLDLRIFGTTRIAAIGPATALELRSFRLVADMVPTRYEAETLANELAVRIDSKQRILLIRASRGREILADTLRAFHHQVEQVVAYQSEDVLKADVEVEHRLRSGSIHWVTVTSSAIARSLVQMFGEDLRRANLVSISPITSGVLHELGFDVAAEATEYTMDGVVEAIVQREALGDGSSDVS